MPKESPNKLKQLQSEAQAFLDEQKIAAGTEKRLPKLQKFVHFWMLVVRSFVSNRCPVRASALAYTTLLALIPLLAVGIGVSTSLLKTNGEVVNQLIEKLVDEVAPQLGLMPASTNTVSFEVTPQGEIPLPTSSAVNQKEETIKRIQKFIATVNSGALGLTGTFALILVAVGLLSNIEKMLNDIWGVTRGRSWFARLVQYWAAITLGPLLMILAMGLTLGGNLETFQTKIMEWSPLLGKILFSGFTLIAPYLLLIAAFMMIYMLMPNTKVHWKAAFVGALVGSVLWNLNSQFNVIFASRVVAASKIYGPLGAVPVFLLGLYISWLIMLFGAQVAYAVQNRRAYLQEKQTEAVNQRGREFVALRLMANIGQRFVNGEKAMTAAELANVLDVPVRLIHQIAHTLVASGLLVEVSGVTTVAVTEVAYDPARPLEKITCHDILTALRAGQGHEPVTRDDPSCVNVRSQFDRIQNSEREVSSRITMFDLAATASAVSPG